MYKLFSVAVLILILNTSCSLIKEQEVFNYDSYNISHNKFDFGFYEIPQSFAISKKCEIYITGTTSKQDDPTDYLMIKMNKIILNASDLVINALTAIKNKNYIEAKNLLEKAISIQPEMFEANHNLAILNFQLGNLDSSILYFEKSKALYWF